MGWYEAQRDAASGRAGGAGPDGGGGDVADEPDILETVRAREAEARAG